MDKLKVMIGGDIVPTTSNMEYFMNGDVVSLLGNGLLQELAQADFTIFNLETPLTDAASPIKKSGPNLIAPTAAMEGLAKINKHCYALANNHILDQGEQGLESTFQALEKYGIAGVGAGNNLKEASKPYILEKQGLKIGIYACAEYEFTIAEEAVAGANPFDPLVSLDHIAALKENCDFVVVLFHGGKEHYQYPSPYVRKVCKRMVDKGASVVIMQHSHCIGCYEEYKNSTIVYGQGNFIFDYLKDELWDAGLLVSVEFQKNKPPATAYKVVTRKQNFIRLAEDKKAEAILAGFQSRSKEILEQGMIEKKYAEFAAANEEYYANLCLGGVRVKLWYRILNKLYGLFRKESYYLGMVKGTDLDYHLYDAIICDAHRELFLRGLRQRMNDTK